MPAPRPSSFKPAVVIGSGVAGLLSAIALAKEQDVLLLTKKKLSDSTTRFSQGGIASVWSSTDSPQQHAQDTLLAGAGLCNKEAVSVLTSQSRQTIKKLIELGIRFDKNRSGRYLLGLEGAHQTPRILHAGGDATGAEIQRALGLCVDKNPRITVLKNSFVIKLLTSERGISGVKYYDQDKTIQKIETPRVILATGGAGKVYSYSSNPDTATGDGITLAFLAGADLLDMEFFQFHPTALNLPGVPNFLISEAMRGEGAILRNEKGSAFMQDHHPLKDLAPRDIVARKIALESKNSEVGHVFLDATNLNNKDVKKRFPTIFKTCFQYGIDISKDRIPITPVAHYLIGGVKTDLWGRTSIPGLYACGEVARTGVHGANRLASNSLLEGAVFALRIGKIFSSDLKTPPIWQKKFIPQSPPPQSEADQVQYVTLSRLMWENAGIVRKRTNLKYINKLLKEVTFNFTELNSTPEDFELFSLRIIGKLISQAAYLRKESRGSHFRSDFPRSVPALNSSNTLNISLLQTID